MTGSGAGSRSFSISDRASFAASESSAPTIASRARDGAVRAVSTVDAAALLVADFTDRAPVFAASAVLLAAARDASAAALTALRSAPEAATATPAPTARR